MKQMNQPLIELNTSEQNDSEQNDIRPVVTDERDHSPSVSERTEIISALSDATHRAVLHTKYTLQSIPNSEWMVTWGLFTGFIVDAILIGVAANHFVQVESRDDCEPLAGTPKGPCEEFFGSQEQTDSYKLTRAVAYTEDFTLRDLLAPDTAAFVLHVFVRYGVPMLYLTAHYLRVANERYWGTDPSERYEKKLLGYCHKPEQTEAPIDDEELRHARKENRRNNSPFSLYVMPLTFVLFLWQVVVDTLTAKAAEKFNDHSAYYESLPNTSSETKKIESIQDALNKSIKSAAYYFDSPTFQIELTIGLMITLIFVAFLRSLKNKKDDPELQKWYIDNMNTYVELKEGITNLASMDISEVEITNLITHEAKNIEIQRNDDAIKIMNLIINDETIKYVNDWSACFKGTHEAFGSRTYYNRTRQFDSEEAFDTHVHSRLSDIENQDSPNQIRTSDVELQPHYIESSRSSSDDEIKSNSSAFGSGSFAHSLFNNTPTETTINPSLTYETLQSDYDHKIIEFRATATNDRSSRDKTKATFKVSEYTPEEINNAFASWLTQVTTEHRHAKYIHCMGELSAKRNSVRAMDPCERLGSFPIYVTNTSSLNV